MARLDVSPLCPQRVSSVHPDNLAILAWSFANAGHVAVELFEVLRPPIIKAAAQGELLPRNIANLAWAYAVIDDPKRGTEHADFMDALAWAASGMIDDFDLQARCGRRRPSARSSMLSPQSQQQHHPLPTPVPAPPVPPAPPSLNAHPPLVAVCVEYSVGVRGRGPLRTAFVRGRVRQALRARGVVAVHPWGQSTPVAPVVVVAP